MAFPILVRFTCTRVASGSSRNIRIGALLCLLASPAGAQTISGIVTDGQRATPTGVTVRVRHTETRFTRSAVTDRGGAYRLAGLPIGSYELVAELAGFRRFTAGGLTVNAGRDVALDITMGLSGRAESVTVSASVPLLSTRSSSVGEIVDLSRIQGLPLNGRRRDIQPVQRCQPRAGTDAEPVAQRIHATAGIRRRRGPDRAARRADRISGHILTVAL